MLIEKIKSQLDAVPPRPSSKGTLRASSSGKCTKAIAYSYHGFEELPTRWRGKLVFKMGDHTESDLVEYASKVGLTDMQKECSAVINGVEIFGHIDGIFNNTHVVDFKSTTTFGFKDAKKGDVGAYLYQVTFYMHALGLSKALLVYYCKETSDLCEVEITYSSTIWNQIVERFTKVINSSPDDLPDRDYEANAKGILPWQCSYCSFVNLCRPDYHLTFNEKGKPELKKIDFLKQPITEDNYHENSQN